MGSAGAADFAVPIAVGYAEVTVSDINSDMLRVGAELAANPAPWFFAASVGWLVAFLPWVLRSLWIYATPRIDGRAG